MNFIRFFLSLNVFIVLNSHCFENILNQNERYRSFVNFLFKIERNAYANLSQVGAISRNENGSFTLNYNILDQLIKNYIEYQNNPNYRFSFTFDANISYGNDNNRCDPFIQTMNEDRQKRDESIRFANQTTRDLIRNAEKNTDLSSNNHSVEINSSSNSSNTNKNFPSLNDYNDLKKKLEEINKSQLTFKRIQAIDKSLNDHSKVEFSQTLTQNKIDLLNYLKLSTGNFEHIKGSHYQIQLFDESNKLLDLATIVWNTTDNQQVKANAELAVIFAHKSCELNKAGKIQGATYLNDGANGFIFFCRGAWNRVAEIPQNVLNALKNPIGVIVNKIEATIDIAKAYCFLCANSVDEFGELKLFLSKEDAAIIDEIRDNNIAPLCEYLQNYLENTSSEKIAEDIGYLFSSVFIESKKAQGISKLFTLKGAELRNTWNKVNTSLRNSQVGNQVAKVIGLMTEHGVDAIEVMLDWAKINPELITAEGTLFKFANNFFEKEKPLLEVFKNHKYGKGVTGEKVLETVKTYEQARNKTFKILKQLGIELNGQNSVPSIGEVGIGKGRIHGRMHKEFKNQFRWRLDYDPIKGPHINIEDFRLGKANTGKGIKIAIPFEGDENTVKKLLDVFDPVKIKSKL